MRPLICFTPIALFLLLISTNISLAEPHFSARTGLRCSRCHVSPTGGGKRTLYGALYAQTNLTIIDSQPRLAWPVSRDSQDSGLTTSLATGDINEWMGVGADLRLSNTTTFLAERTNSFDLTEGTLYLELRPVIDRVILYLDEDFGVGGARNREAWAMIRGPWHTYLRGGRLFPPFGLRLLDDEAYTRRSTGANFANSDLGLELGGDLGPVFFAVALTNGTFGGSDTDYMKAIWALLELNMSPFRFGISGNYNPTNDGCRSMAGVFAALGLGRFVIQGEADFIGGHAIEPNARQIYQFTGMAEADVLLTKGFSLRLGWDYHDADLELTQDRRQRFRFGIDLFPWRMLEFKLYYVMKQSETDNPEEDADRLEVMLHVFL